MPDNGIAPRDQRSTALSPTSGASKDFVAALVRGAFLFVVWFFAGGLGVEAPLYDRRRIAAFALIRVLVVAVLVLLAVWGVAHPALAAFFITLLLVGGLFVFLVRAHARQSLFLVATRDTNAHAALDHRAVTAPRLMVAHDLQSIALGVDRIRRGDAAGAAAAVASVDEGRLMSDEVRMTLAVRALAASAQNDPRGAAVLALRAFPTGALEIDERIGRLSIDTAWHDGMRLAAILDEWEARGVAVSDATALGELVRFSTVKLGRMDPSVLEEVERARLADFAHEHGDLETERRVRASAPASSQGYR